MILSAVHSVQAADVDNQKLAVKEFAKGKKAYDAKNYNEAQPLLEKAAELGSRDTTIQYYLALAALGNKDYGTFQRALARIIIHRHPSSGVNTKSGAGYQAQQLLSRYYPDCQPFPCLPAGVGDLSRFVKRDMPIKVYISPGLMLPKGARGVEGIAPHGMLPLLLMFQKGLPFFNSLERDPGYTATLASAVTNGINQWDWARREQILDFKIVNSPVGANVLVFWCPSMVSGHGAYTQAMSSSTGLKKVFIEVSTVKGNTDYSKLTWTIAHEFGHALGISYHSLNPKDLMFARSNAESAHGRISENDKLTLRALYDVAPTVAR